MRLSVWSMLCGVPTLAVIGILALSAVSCRSQKCMEQRVEMREDSLREVSTESVTVETVLQAVPGDSVGVTVPMTVMQSLPEGAAFSQKKGRTRVSLRREGNNIVAEAETDSIGRTGRRYERRARDNLSKSSSGSKSNESSKEPEKTRNWCWLIGLIGLLGLMAGIVIRKRLKQH